MELLRRTSRTTLAIATAVLIFVALFAGYILDLTDNESGDADYVGWLIVSAVASVIGAALLLRFVPETESEASDDNKPARRGLVLAVVAFVTMAVFWTGLPFALGVPALVLGAEGRVRSATQGHSGEAAAAMVLAGFAILAGFVVCIVG
jgi:hypothetical protein